MSPADSPRPLVVTIDGPAASGKSSTARMVAERLGARHVDSGALYRAATAAALRGGGDPTLWTEAAVLERASHVALAPGPTTFVATIDGAPCETELRTEAVDALVSVVARMEHVRLWVNEQVRLAASASEVVVDGRDMGTVVFPEAALKVWLVALPSERARRRILQRTGRQPGADLLESETAELELRDRRDSLQTKPAADAIWIDGTGISQEEQVHRIVELALERRGTSTH